MLNVTDIDKLFKRYVIQVLILIVVLVVATLCANCLVKIENLSVSLSVAAIFSFVVSMAEGIIWRRVATKGPDSLPTFFTAVSGFRMLLALATIFIYYLASGRGEMLEFCIVFMAFYFAFLIHHSVFFSRVSNSHYKCDKEK